MTGNRAVAASRWGGTGQDHQTEQGGRLMVENEVVLFSKSGNSNINLCMLGYLGGSVG